MKKSLATLIFSLFLLLILCRAGLAKTPELAIPGDHTFLSQAKISPNLSTCLLFDRNNFAPLHFPFISVSRTIGYEALSAYFPFLDALLSAKDLLWTEIANWNPIPSVTAPRLHIPEMMDGAGNSSDSNQLTSHDHMGISLNHDIGPKKSWSFSLDLGIALQNDHTIASGHDISDGPFPKLGMNLSDQNEDLFDQLRSAAPFIGVGISCRF